MLESILVFYVSPIVATLLYHAVTDGKDLLSFTRDTQTSRKELIESFKNMQ